MILAVIQNVWVLTSSPSALSQAGSSIVGSEDIVEGDRPVVYTESMCEEGKLGKFTIVSKPIDLGWLVAYLGSIASSFSNFY